MSAFVVNDSSTRSHFGVIVRGCFVGHDHYFCDRRATANRIRRVLRLWREHRGWSGPATLSILIQFAVDSHGKHAAEICRNMRICPDSLRR